MTPTPGSGAGRARANAAYTLDESIVPMHHHSGRARDDFLCAIEPDGPRPISVAEANHRAVHGCGIADLTSAAKADDGPAGLSRRMVLRGGAGALGLLAAPNVQPRMVYSAGPTDKDILICIFLRGGFDGLSAVVPAGDPHYLNARPSLGVTAAKGLIPLNSFWGLHPQLSALTPIWNAGELALVHATGNTDPTRSHFAGMWSMERAAGYGASAAQVSSGWLGRHLASSSSTQGTFRAITLGNKAVASLSTSFPTVAFASIADFEIWVWEGIQNEVRTMIDSAYRTVGGPAGAMAAKTLAAVGGLADLRGTPYTPDNGAVYPDTYFGHGLIDIARMIKSGKGLEVACIDIGDWDMHADLGQATDQASWFSRKARDLAQGLAALRTDLGSRWANVCVVTMSEFGRRVGENASGGVDHGHGNTMFVLGGQVNGGQVYGSWPGLAPEDLDMNEGGYNGDVTITTDYRTVLAELISDRLQNGALGTVFPNFSYPGPVGVFR